MTRDKPRDVYDLWFLFRRGVALDMASVRRKLALHGLEYDPDGLLTAAGSMKGAWRMDLGSLVMGRLPNFDEVFLELEENLNRKGRNR